MAIVRKLYLQKIVKEIQVISRKIKQDEEDKKVSAKWKYALYAAMVHGKESRISVSFFIFFFINSGDGQILPGSVCSVHDNLISCHLYLSSSKCYCILTEPLNVTLDTTIMCLASINCLLNTLTRTAEILPLAD